MKGVFTVLLISMLGSCSYKYETVNHVGYESGSLSHMVILTLKDSVTENRKEEIISSLESLKKIKEAKGLAVLTPAHTNDSRAKEDYDIILQMSFKNEKDLARYSQDPYHLEVRKDLVNDLLDSPIVYDCWVE